MNYKSISVHVPKFSGDELTMIIIDDSNFHIYKAGMGPGPDGLQVKKLIPEVIGKEIEKQCKGIFPLKDCMIRKVKIMKKPKFDITKPLGEDVWEVPHGKIVMGYTAKSGNSGEIADQPIW